MGKHLDSVDVAGILLAADTRAELVFRQEWSEQDTLYVVRVGTVVFTASQDPETDGDSVVMSAHDHDSEEVAVACAANMEANVANLVALRAAGIYGY